MNKTEILILLSAGLVVAGLAFQQFHYVWPAFACYGLSIVVSCIAARLL